MRWTLKKIIFLTNKNFNIKKIFLFYKINFLSFAIVKNSLSLSPIYNKKKKIQLQSINLAFLEEDPIPKNQKQIKKKRDSMWKQTFSHPQFGKIFLPSSSPSSILIKIPLHQRSSVTGVKLNDYEKKGMPDRACSREGTILIT